jgi:hypothetical protein
MTAFVNGTNLNVDPTDPNAATVKGITPPSQPQVQPAISTGIAPVPTAPPASTATSGVTPYTPPPQDLPAVKDDGVATRVAALTSEDSPLMQQARTAGLQQANARGVLNSSIGIGAAQDSAIRAALPIAQQEAQEAANSNSQRYDLAAQMDRLRAQAGFNSQAAAENYSYTSALNTQGYQYQAQQAQNQQQFEKDMAAVQQGNAVDLANLNATLQSKLQAQGNTEQLQRMSADFANQLGLQSNAATNALNQIKAQGDVQLNLQANQFQEAMKELTLSLNEQNSVAMANAAVNLFNAEAGLRSALLSNDNIPAAERAGYEQQISALTAPTRNYISAVLGYVPSGSSTPTTTNPGVVPPSGGIAPATGAAAGGGDTSTSPLEALRRNGGQIV